MKKYNINFMIFSCVVIFFFDIILIGNFINAQENYIDNIQDIAYFNNRLYVSTNNQMFMSSDFGNTWQKLRYGYEIYKIIYDNNKTYLIGDTACVVLNKENGYLKTIIYPIELKHDLVLSMKDYNISIKNDNILFSDSKFGGHRNFYFSSNDGLEWKEFDLSKFLERDGVKWQYGTQMVTSSDKIILIHTHNDKSDNYIYISNDKGEKWKRIENDLNLEDFKVENNKIYAKKKNSFYISLDDGENWKKIAELESIINPSDKFKRYKIKKYEIRDMNITGIAEYLYNSYYFNLSLEKNQKNPEIIELKKDFDKIIRVDSLYFAFDLHYIYSTNNLEDGNWQKLNKNEPSITNTISYKVNYDSTLKIYNIHYEIKGIAANDISNLLNKKKPDGWSDCFETMNYYFSVGLIKMGIDSTEIIKKYSIVFPISCSIKKGISPKTIIGYRDEKRYSTSTRSYIYVSVPIYGGGIEYNFSDYTFGKIQTYDITSPFVFLQNFFSVTDKGIYRISFDVVNVVSGAVNISQCTFEVK